MSGPSFDNIDRWLFEYVEGNLTQEQEKQLEAFLLDHPEFDLDLDSWQMAKVEPLSFEFPNQETLYREEKKRRRILPYLIGFSALTSVLAFSIFLLLDSEDNSILKKIELVTRTSNTQTKNNKKIVNSGRKNSIRTYSSKPSVNYVQKNNQASRSILTTNSTSIFSKNADPILVNLSNVERDEIHSNRFVDVFNVDTTFLATSNNDKISDDFNSENSNKNSVDSTISNDLTIQNPEQISSENQSNKEEKNKKINDKPSNSKLTLKKLVKDLNKFMGDEIRLKNTRDHQIHVPGLSQIDANFSSAGDISATRFRTISRAQWLGKENQAFTNQLALDWYSKSLKSGFGIQGNYQVYGNGVIQNWNTALIYSPKILLSKSFLIEPGIRFKMGSKILTSNLINNTNKVEIERDNSIDFYADGSIPIGTNQWYRDLGTSLLIHSKWFYIGAQADNLLRHQDNIYSNSITNPKRAGIYYSVNLGTEYESKTGDLSFSPYGYYEKFENREEAWGGFNFQYKAWSIGGALSNKSNFALSTGLRFATFALTYQFDQTYSNLLGSSASSHQLTIMFNTKVSRSSRRYIQLK
jgi:hypothetical protein